MKATKVKILVLSGLILVSAFLGGWYFSHQDKTLGVRTQAEIIKEISSKEAESLIEKNRNSDNFAIIDVRTPEEYAGGHLSQTINLDYRSQTFNDELGKLDKNKTYLIYCQSGNRSQKALDIMKELGFKEVYNLSGGITKWSADGMPTVK